MGAEATATISIGTRSETGRALLESNEIIFRGGLRLKIPFKDITTVDAANGRLRIEYRDGTAIFTLGDQAAKWADKIKHPKTRADKLGIKPGHHVAILGVRDSTFIAELRERRASVSTGRLKRDVDVIFIGIEDAAGLAQIAKVVPNLKRDGAVCTVTPKGKGGIKDTDVMAAAKGAGLVAVKVAAFSETHSANKFVIPKDAR